MVFAKLLVLTLVCSLIVLLHLFEFVIILAGIVYIILDFDYLWLGIIRLGFVDQRLIDLLARMK